jgi:hypothetical protein
MDVQAGIFTQAELCQVTGLNSVTVDTWLIRGILRTTKVGGRTLRGRRQEFFPVMAPRSAATKVMVFQWPCGTCPTSRSPRAQRPYSRTILVLADVVDEH